jgi:L-amino acid N-acyltransferase YncA
MNFDVRTFRESDVSPANALTNVFILDTPIHFAENPATDSEFRETWSRLQPRFPWLAATVDGRFAGYAKSGPWRERAAYRFTIETSVYLDPQFHRRGIGRALMVELLDRAAKAGMRTAVAGATLPNPASAALHEALGFKPAGIFPRVGYKFGQCWDVGFWTRELDLGQLPIA